MLSKQEGHQYNCHTVWHVKCGECNATSPYGATQDSAALAWNKSAVLSS
jgi:hypothetical protein